MKKIYLTLIALITVFTACTDQFADYNTDKKHPANVPGESLFSNAQKEMSDYVNNTNVNINIFKLMSQYWTETTYTDEANYDLITRNIPANIYLRLYMRVLTDLKRSDSLIRTKPVIFPDVENPVKQNKLQMIEIMDVYVYSQLVDIFGAVPYSEALNPNNVYPKYDDGVTIYKDLFARLDMALSKLDVNAESFGSSDIYYGGDVAAWIKFGNSLKIRMAITVSDASDASLHATSKAALESAATKCFSSNDDDCMLKYVTSAPNYNQLYADLIATGRHDFVPANTIIDQMASLTDPRLDSYFSSKVSVSFPIKNNKQQVDTMFVEVPVLMYYKDGTKALLTPDSVLDVYSNTNKFGIIIPQADTIREPSYYLGGQFGYSSPFGQCSHIADVIQKPDFPGIMLTYTEVQFYLAEAAERGYSLPKTAEAYYNEGIKSSFAFWGTSGVASYLADPKIAYTTATGTWKQKIGLQSWIANYTRGMEAYNTWRRLDYPIFNIPELVESYNDIPVRFTFPVNEQTLNADKYKAAATAIGGDLITTKIFWDKY